MTGRQARCGWLWLFPASYAVHIAEEGLAGEGFYRWIHRVVGREMSPRAFVGLNLAYEVAMVAVVRQAATREEATFVTPALGALTTANGVGHLAGSLATGRYSPGVVTGVVLWAPLGVFALARSRRQLDPTTWRRGVALGLGTLVAVAVVALPFTSARRP